MLLVRLDYVLVRHFWLAVHALILFAVGLFVAVPVVRYRLTAIERLPLGMLRLVARLIGEGPALWRTAAVIWLFNSSVMFVGMASGVHPMLPKVFGIWTGLNVGVAAAHAGREDDPLPGLLGRAGGGQWRPPQGLVIACGAVVLALELPCFWYALAMGMSMGWKVQAGGIAYLDSLAPRALAYLTTIVPALLVSAVAEAVALRAASPPGRED